MVLSIFLQLLTQYKFSTISNVLVPELQATIIAMIKRWKFQRVKNERLINAFENNVSDSPQGLSENRRPHPHRPRPGPATFQSPSPSGFCCAVRDDKGTDIFLNRQP